MTNQKKEKLLTKVKRPTHINYISQYILNLPIQETRVLINKYVSDGILEESKYGKEYYVIKNQDENN